MPRYQIYTVRRALLAECTAGMSRNLGRKSLMRFAISGVDSGERGRPWAMLMAAGWWSRSPSLALREPTESHGFNGFWCTVAPAYMGQGYKVFLDIRSIFGWSRIELVARPLRILWRWLCVSVLENQTLDFCMESLWKFVDFLFRSARPR